MTSATGVGPVRRHWDRGLYVLAGILVAGGSILPWATVSASFLDPVYKAGIDGDGRLTLTLGLALIGLGAAAFLPSALVRRVVPVLILVVATVVTVVALVNVAGVRSAAGPLSPEARVLVDTQAGIGLWLTLVGGVAGICASVLALLPSAART
jgi:hypothetical protein